MARRAFTEQYTTLQALLRQMRLDVGLRQVDLAQRLNQPQSFVSKYEAGERRLDLVQLHQICVALGVQLEDLARRFEEAVHET